MSMYNSLQLSEVKRCAIFREQGATYLLLGGQAVCEDVQEGAIPVRFHNRFYPRYHCQWQAGMEWVGALQVTLEDYIREQFPQLIAVSFEGDANGFTWYLNKDDMVRTWFEWARGTGPKPIYDTGSIPPWAVVVMNRRLK
jgi:hypothetical protein